jgi:hypothetical protein
MPLEEQAEEKIQGVVQNIIQAGVRYALKVPKGVALGLLRGGAKLAKKGTVGAAHAVKEHLDSGQVSEKKLQKLEGGDLHDLRLDDGTLKQVIKSLNEAGVRFSVEPTKEGSYFLHFAGKNEDHVKHAVERAFKKMGLEINEEDFIPDPQPTVEETREQAEQAVRTTQEAPAQREEPEPVTAEMPQVEHGSVDWDAVDPEVMDAATAQLAARHPELSWGKVMGDAKWDEQSQQHYTYQVRDAALGDPDLGKELDGILHDDFGQPFQPQQALDQAQPETDRQAKSAPAESSAQAEPFELSDETKQQFREDVHAQAAKLDDKAGEPKPIKSKKDLFDRFRKKLRTNLDAQATQKPMVPTQSRTHKPTR